MDAQSPLSLPVSVTVELSFEEFEEGALAVQQHIGQRLAKSPATRAWAAGLGVGVGVGLVLLLTWGSSLDSNATIRPAGYSVITAFIPVITLAILAFGLRAYHVRRAGVRVSAWKVIAKVVGFAVLIGVVFALLAALQYLTYRQRLATVAGGPPPPEPARDWFGTLFPHAMWVLIAIQVAIIAARNTTPQLRRLWEWQPSLRRPTRVEIHVDGVEFDNGVSRRTHAWTSFVRVHETRSLLLLCPSEVTFESLPKRAFASPEAYEAVKQFLTANIQPPETLPVGFPVLRNPPPLPHG